MGIGERGRESVWIGERAEDERGEHTGEGESKGGASALETPPLGMCVALEAGAYSATTSKGISTETSLWNFTVAL